MESMEKEIIYENCLLAEGVQGRVSGVKITIMS